jgi:Ca-activated chloride channel family protein
VSFSWPLSLLALAAVPAVFLAYRLALRRRRRRAVTYSSLALLRQAIPRRSRLLRHVPIGLLLLSLGVLALAAARPQLTESVPTNETSVILALDESGSMCSTDLTPNRLAVAQKAALHYVANEPSGTRIGLVLFNSFAELVVAPTTNRKELDQELDNLSTAPGTAIGAAMLTALNAIAEIDSSVAPIGAAATIGAAAPSNPFEGAGNSGVTLTPERTTPEGGYVPDVVVLLTDGANNRGISPLQAAPYAVARKVRVYTIGFGTTSPGPLICTPQQQGGVDIGGGFGPQGGFGGGGFGGGGYGRPLVADLPPLQEVARLTGGESYTARSASELDSVFKNLPKQIAVQKAHHEITSELGLLGALIALLAFGAAIRWSPYP